MQRLRSSAARHAAWGTRVGRVRLYGLLVKDHAPSVVLYAPEPWSMCHAAASSCMLPESKHLVQSVGVVSP